jgi:DNA-binding XRE family transcriptional regulator
MYLYGPWPAGSLTRGRRAEPEIGTCWRLRARLKPEEAGIRPEPPAVRRVPGLRRDELARLAGVSEEHLRRLEQGRRDPSRQVVDALGRALRLGRDEHARLCLLAGFAAPDATLRAQWTVPEASWGGPPPGVGARSTGGVPRKITAPAQRMLDRLTDVPVCVCDASWTVLAGNRPWTEARCGSDVPGRHERNIAWRLFTGVPTNVVRSAEHLSGFKESVVADLRTALQRYPADPQPGERTIGLPHLAVTALRSLGAETRPEPPAWSATPAAKSPKRYTGITSGRVLTTGAEKWTPSSAPLASPPHPWASPALAPAVVSPASIQPALPDTTPGPARADGTGPERFGVLP